MKSFSSVSRKALMALAAIAALLLSGPVALAQQVARGKVLDSKGEPVIGAAVYVPGTTQGVITDTDGIVDGKYLCPIPETEMDSVPGLYTQNTGW